MQQLPEQSVKASPSKQFMKFLTQSPNTIKNKALASSSALEVSLTFANLQKNKKKHRNSEQFQEKIKNQELKQSSPSKKFMTFLTQSPNTIKNKALASSSALEANLQKNKKKRRNSEELQEKIPNSTSLKNSKNFVNFFSNSSSQIAQRTNNSVQNFSSKINQQKINQNSNNEINMYNSQFAKNYNWNQEKPNQLKKIGNFFTQSKSKTLTKSLNSLSELNNKLQKQIEEEKAQHESIKLTLQGQNQNSSFEPLNSADFTYSMDPSKLSSMGNQNQIKNSQQQQQKKKEINWNEEEEILPDDNLTEYQSILVTANENFEPNKPQKLVQKISAAEQLFNELKQAEQERKQLENQLSKVNSKITVLRVKLKPLESTRTPQTRSFKQLSPVQKLTQKRINDHRNSMQKVNQDVRKEHELLKEQLKLERQQQILERLREKKYIQEKQKEMKQQSQQFVRKLYKHPYYKLMDWKSRQGVGKARYVVAGDESPEGSFVGIEDELKKLKDYQTQIQELDQYIQEQQISTVSPDQSNQQLVSSIVGQQNGSMMQGAIQNTKFQQYFSPQVVTSNQINLRSKLAIQDYQGRQANTDTKRSSNQKLPQLRHQQQNSIFQPTNQQLKEMQYLQEKYYQEGPLIKQGEHFKQYPENLRPWKVHQQLFSVKPQAAPIQQIQKNYSRNNLHKNQQSESQLFLRNTSEQKELLIAQKNYQKFITKDDFDKMQQQIQPNRNGFPPI